MCSLHQDGVCRQTTFVSFFAINQLAPTSTLFPYTTLFRSRTGVDELLHVPSPSCPSSFRPQHCTVRDRKSTRLNSSHVKISYAVFCLKKKKKYSQWRRRRRTRRRRRKQSSDGRTRRLQASC